MTQLLHPRRQFLAFALAGVAGSVVPRGFAQTAPATPQARRFVIDTHHHYGAAPGYIERLVKVYRPRNAMACVLTPMTGFEVVRRAAAQHPDVVIPYGQISVDHPDVMEEIQKFAAAGFRGVKMHTPKYNWDDFGYFPIYEKLQALRLVALFHTGIVSGSSDDPEPSSMARMRPSFLHTIARSFPKLVIQGAHLGNPWYDEAAEAARWEKNLYFDLTGSSLIKKAKNLAVFKEYLWWEGPTAHSSPDAVYAFEKLVFGTDEDPESLDACLARYEAMLDACAVPEASRRKIYGETMARILGIKPRA
ncbi:MAG: amidohydrolase family protein [Blastocatellia bacterium]|nr:amidohydrolase family protein [Blastocatellia bacterium]